MIVLLIIVGQSNPIFIAVLPIPILLIANACRFASKRNKAVLTSKEMVLFFNKQSRKNFAWADISRIDWTAARAAIAVWGHYDNLIHVIPSDNFGSGKRATQFLRAAQRWKAKYDSVTALKQNNNPSPPQNQHQENA